MRRMNRDCLRLFLFLQALLYLPSVILAQTGQETVKAGETIPLGGAGTQQPNPEFDASEGLIHLDVSVSDSSGEPVSGLTAKDFTILDEGQPQPILSFREFSGGAGADGNVEVVLVLDQLNLSSEQAAAAEHAMRLYLQSSRGQLPQPVMVYVLSEAGLAVTSGPSSDGNALVSELSSKKGLRVIWPDVLFYQMGRVRAIQNFNYRNFLSLSALGSVVIEERRRQGRKLVFWMGNGWPVGGSCEDSFDWITEFSTRMRESRITLSSISVWPNPAERGFDYKQFLDGVNSAKQQSSYALSLQVLAAQSGGAVDASSNNLERMIADGIRKGSAYYTLSFDPPRVSHADEYHELRVQVSVAALAVKTSIGYYDQPVFYDETPTAAERVSVEQLAALLETLHGLSDSDGAGRLEGLELTERMSTKQVECWRGRLHGAKTWAALVFVADASSFLNQPAAKTPLPEPDLDAQRKMLAKTVEYLGKTIPRLPNFFAVRTTARYRQPLQKEGESWKVPAGDQSLHTKASTSTTVLYRTGYDVTDASGTSRKNSMEEEKLNEMDMSGFGRRKEGLKEPELNTKGTFGPILSTVVFDAAHSTLRWSRWVQDTDGMRAAFRYAVPEEKSHYEVTYCCLAEGDGTTMFRRLSAYHGEIQVDPESGTILRLTVEADISPRQPIIRSDILVEYASQVIGGTSYTCPVRSVRIWRGRRGEMVHEWARASGCMGRSRRCWMM